jgi:hypothetical protein
MRENLDTRVPLFVHTVTLLVSISVQYTRLSWSLKSAGRARAGFDSQTGRFDITFFVKTQARRGNFHARAKAFNSGLVHDRYFPPNSSEVERKLESSLFTIQEDKRKENIFMQ